MEGRDGGEDGGLCVESCVCRGRRRFVSSIREKNKQIHHPPPPQVKILCLSVCLFNCVFVPPFTLLSLSNKCFQCINMQEATRRVCEFKSGVHLSWQLALHSLCWGESPVCSQFVPPISTLFSPPWLHSFTLLGTCCKLQRVVEAERFYLCGSISHLMSQRDSREMRKDFPKKSLEEMKRETRTDTKRDPLGQGCPKYGSGANHGPRSHVHMYK